MLLARVETVAPQKWIQPKPKWAQQEQQQPTERNKTASISPSYHSVVSAGQIQRISNSWTDQTPVSVSAPPSHHACLPTSQRVDTNHQRTIWKSRNPGRKLVLMHQKNSLETNRQSSPRWKMWLKVKNSRSRNQRTIIHCSLTGRRRQREIYLRENKIGWARWRRRGRIRVWDRRAIGRVFSLMGRRYGICRADFRATMTRWMPSWYGRNLGFWSQLFPFRRRFVMRSRTNTRWSICKWTNPRPTTAELRPTKAAFSVPGLENSRKNRQPQANWVNRLATHQQLPSKHYTRDHHLWRTSTPASIPESNLLKEVDLEQAHQQLLSDQIVPSAPKSSQAWPPSTQASSKQAANQASTQWKNA